MHSALAAAHTLLLADCQRRHGHGQVQRVAHAHTRAHTHTHTCIPLTCACAHTLLAQAVHAEDVVQLSCKHCFHDLCIRGWTMVGGALGGRLIGALGAAVCGAVEAGALVAGALVQGPGCSLPAACLGAGRPLRQCCAAALCTCEWAGRARARCALGQRGVHAVCAMYGIVVPHNLCAACPAGGQEGHVPGVRGESGPAHAVRGPAMGDAQPHVVRAPARGSGLLLGGKRGTGVQSKVVVWCCGRGQP